MTDGKPSEKSQRQANGFNVTIGGNVGPGTVIGPGSVSAKYIAGRDVVANDADVVSGKTPEDFQKMLKDLRQLIEQAYKSGELDATATKTALKNVQAAADMAMQDPPPKRRLVRSLEVVSDVLEAAADTVDAAGSAARVVLKAIPVAALVLKLATYLF